MTVRQPDRCFSWNRAVLEQLSALQLWHLQLQARACPELADAGTVPGSTWIRQCRAAEGAAQAWDRANNTQCGIAQGVAISSGQWQVRSVLPDVLGDGLPDLNNVYNSSEYTGFIWCISFQRLWEVLCEILVDLSVSYSYWDRSSIWDQNLYFTAWN